MTTTLWLSVIIASGLFYFVLQQGAPWPIIVCGVVWLVLFVFAVITSLLENTV